MEYALEKHLAAGGYDAPGWGPDYVAIHSAQMEKTAGSLYTPPELTTVIEKLRPRPEGRYILLHAIGAYEYWGANRNGDAFPEWSLRSMLPPEDVKRLLDGPVRKACPNFSQPPTARYGCKTFVEYAHVYRGHANKDPLKACGDVVAAAYNERMHRIELIVFVYTERAPDIIDRIDRGAPVAWSMGAKLPFDVCSICANVARTRAHYCSHMAKELNVVYPDGRKVFSYNYFPRFFDISEVGVPADRSAWTLAKVAGLSLPVPPLRPTFKIATIEKRPPAQSSESMGKAPIDPKLLSFLSSAVSRDYCETPDLPDAQLMAMKRHGVAQSLAASALMGILLRPREVQKIAGDPSQLPEQLEFASVDRKLLSSFDPYLASRSLFEPFITKRAARRELSKVASSLSPNIPRSPVFDKYAGLIQSMDHEKWAEAIESDPAVRFALDPDALVSAVTGTRGPLPPWLPFAVGSVKLL